MFQCSISPLWRLSTWERAVIGYSRAVHLKCPLLVCSEQCVVSKQFNERLNIIDWLRLILPLDVRCAEEPFVWRRYARGVFILESIKCSLSLSLSLSLVNFLSLYVGFLFLLYLIRMEIGSNLKSVRLAELWNAEIHRVNWAGWANAPNQSDDASPLLLRKQLTILTIYFEITFK